MSRDTLFKVGDTTLPVSNRDQVSKTSTPSPTPRTRAVYIKQAGNPGHLPVLSRASPTTHHHHADLCKFFNPEKSFKTADLLIEML